MSPYLKGRSRRKLIFSPHQARNFLLFLVAGTILILVTIAQAQQLTCDFNQNGRHIKLVCLFGPTDTRGNFVPPASSDPGVVAITRSFVSTQTIDGQTFEKQVVLAELRNIGVADLTVGTATQVDSFKIPALNPILAVEIPGVLPLGTLPAGDFVGLNEGEMFAVQIRTVSLEDGTITDFGGVATLELEGSSAFTFEPTAQSTLVHFGGGIGSASLKIADQSLGETAKLRFQLEGTAGPTIPTNFQIPLASVQYDEATQSIDAPGVPITFRDANNEPLAVMTFTEENLDSVLVRTLKFSENGNDPFLVLPVFPDGRLLPRFYLIKAYPGEAAFNTSLTLFYSDLEFGASGIEDESMLGLFRFNGSSWEAWDGQTDPTNNAVTVDGVDSFSIWALGSSSGRVTGVDRTLNGIPSQPSLEQNYPNPFNPTTKIEYKISREARVLVRIFNLRGQLVRTLVDEFMAPGSYSTEWDGTDDRGRVVPSGIYYYRIKAGDFEQTRKMIVLK